MIAAIYVRKSTEQDQPENSQHLLELLGRIIEMGQLVAKGDDALIKRVG